MTCIVYTNPGVGLKGETEMKNENYEGLFRDISNNFYAEMFDLWFDGDARDGEDIIPLLGYGYP